MRPLLSLLLFAASLSAAHAQRSPLHRDGYAPELVNLQSEYQKALDAYYTPIRKAKSDEDRMKIRLDPARDPGRQFAPRFLALARRASGTDTAARSLLTVMEIDRSTGPGSPSSLALKELLARYAANPIMDELADMLRYTEVGSSGQARSALEQIVARSPRKSARASALLNLARITLSDSGAAESQKEAARGNLRRLSREFGDTRAGKAAVHELFESENLQIGMTAPDFEAADETGSRFKLSDYRGKVVVLDFWGFW